MEMGLGVRSQDKLSWSFLALDCCIRLLFIHCLIYDISLLSADPGVVLQYLVAVVGPPVVQVVAHRSYKQGKLLQAAQV